MEHRPFREWSRSEARREFDVPAVAYRPDGSRSSVVLSELSYEGCRLAASDRFDIGEELILVVLEFGTEIAATVRWAAPGELGLRFSVTSQQKGSTSSGAEGAL